MFKFKEIYPKILEQGYNEKNFVLCFDFMRLDWTGQEARLEKLSLDKFWEDYPFLKIDDPDFFFMSGLHSFLRGEYKDATIFLMKQLKQNKSDLMCRKFLDICFEIIRAPRDFFESKNLFS